VRIKEYSFINNYNNTKISREEIRSKNVQHNVYANKKQVSCGYQDEIELVGTIFFMFYSKCNGKYDW